MPIPLLREVAGRDGVGVLPVGVVLPYCGTALPGSGIWDWADGALIDRLDANGVPTLFYTRIGHAYNGNVDPGGTPPKVKKPDYRGRLPVGSVNYGAGAAILGTDNARAQVSRGGFGGEQRHVLALTEEPPHVHDGNIPSHGHYVTIPDHLHAFAGAGAYVNGHNRTFGPAYGGGEQAAFANSLSGAGGGYTGAADRTLAANTGGPSATAFTTASRKAGGSGAAAGHENMPPFQACHYIVRIA